MGVITPAIGLLGGLNEMWASIIDLFGFIPNFGWMLIFFTVCLKLLLSPLDFWQRKVSRESAKKQARLAPEIAKIKKQYGNNKQLENQKTMELYKRENYNILGSCLGMVVNMAVTLFIFISLFYALMNMSHIKIQEQYYELRDGFVAVRDADILAGVANPSGLELKVEIEAGTAVVLFYDDAAEDWLWFADIDEQDLTDAVAAGQFAVVEKYNVIKNSWLWIQNIWRPDTWVSPFPNFDDYKKMTALNLEGAALQEYKDTYNEVTFALQAATKDKWNGLLILVVLAAVVTFFSVIVSQSVAASNKKKNDTTAAAAATAQANPMGGAMKIMKYVLPLFMVFIAFTYSSAFSLYIITNSLCMALLGLLFNFVLNKLEAKKEGQAIVTDNQNKAKIDYKRK